MKQEHLPSKTKERILDAAEQLFAERGFDGVSLRRIIGEAKVNLAAVHYHFHSKEGLLDAVFARRIETVNQERMAWLDRVEAAAGGRPIPVEQILEILLVPVVRLVRDPSRNGPTFCRIFGRLLAEGGTRLPVLFKKHMGESLRRFLPVMQQALPDLQAVELFWRLHFVMGAMSHTLRASQVFQVLSGGVMDPCDLEGGARRLIPFLAAGLRSPVPVVESEVNNAHA